MVVKGNHPTLEKKLRAFFSGSCLFGAEFERATQQNIAHGRIETRSILTSSDLPKNYTGFPGVKQAFRLTRKVVFKKTGEIREETIYGMTDLSSKQATPSDLLTLLRGHWHIENKSHHVRDVTFDEDRSRVRSGGYPLGDSTTDGLPAQRVHRSDASGAVPKHSRDLPTICSKARQST